MENMHEQLLNSNYKPGADDNSDISFPAGTPFKGVVHSADFIYGDALATLVGLSSGGVMNNAAGWLHFIEDTGLELYIAKKPIRYATSYEAIMAATNNGGKEVTIRGEVYICRLLSGAISTAAPANAANAGGEWNRYMYNVYDNTDRASIPDALLWGNYTIPMLGLANKTGSDLSDGVFTVCSETVTNGYVLRGNDWQVSNGNPIKGIWNMPANNPQTYYGWRPVLVKKSSIPPSPYKGIVAGADLITPDALMTAIGVSGGTAPPDTDPGWLKFVDNGKTFYIAKKPMRLGLLWETLNGVGAVKGAKVITIGSKQYRVRLMTGGDKDPASAEGGEYDAYYTRVTGHWTAADRWGYLTDADIYWNASTGAGELTLCQEQWASNGPLTRGYPGFNGIWYQSPGATHAGYGWRPVLEEVIPLTDTWEKFVDLPAPRNGASAVIINNKMYVFGGTGADSIPVGTLWEIDLTTKAIVAKTSDTARRDHAAVAINGKMYVYGGYTTGYDGSVRIYDPVANSWSSGTSGSIGARAMYGAYNGKLYAVGGIGGVTNGRIYNPVANSWDNAWGATGVGLNQAQLARMSIVNAKAYMMGGYENPTMFRVADLVTNVGKNLAAPLSGRSEYAAASGRNGMYLFGGVVTVTNADKAVHRYDIDSDSWSVLGTIPYTVGTRATTCQDTDGSIYVVGGNVSTNVYKYTP
jgi:N-acetylneuraminic acid mutarotase